jgi:hypothetical protein
VREFDFPAESADSIGSDRIADRLDALQMDAVERVLRRAIQLQSEDDLGLDTLDGDRVATIARELGIDTRHVEQALFEERIGERIESLNVLDRLLAPPRLSGRTTVMAPRAEVEAAADAWFARHEGLRKRRAVRDGALWERDPSAITKIRMGLKLGHGTGALRSTGGLAHRIYSGPSGEQVVGIDVDTRIIGRTARVLLAAGTAVGLILAILFGLNFGWQQAVAGAVGSLAAFGVAAVTTAKTWTSRIRRGIRRALDAISSPGIAGVHESTVDRVSKAIKALTDLGRDVRRKM